MSELIMVIIILSIFVFFFFKGIVVTTTAKLRSRLNCAIGAKVRRGTQGKEALQRNRRL